MGSITILSSMLFGSGASNRLVDDEYKRHLWNYYVSALPEGKPIIVSERERYNPGDTLRANCSLPPSKPPAQLSFTLNNVAVSDTYNPRVIIESAVTCNREINGVKVFLHRVGLLVLYLTALFQITRKSTWDIWLGSKRQIRKDFPLSFSFPYFVLFYCLQR